MREEDQGGFLSTTRVRTSPYADRMTEQPILVSRPLSQVDVFTATPYLGNPVAVVQDGVGLTDAQMSLFTRWTNLSECAFLLPPTESGREAGADYRVRIFTPDGELPFAGHPTLGACHAWLEAGGVPRAADRVVQECGVGLVPLRRDGGRLAFAAPALRTDTPIDEDRLAAIVEALGVPRDAVADHRQLDNGPTWHVLLLDSAERVVSLSPDFGALRVRYPGLDVGVVGPYGAARGTATVLGTAGTPSGAAAIEVRGFALGMGIPEDPVTGSLNAAVGQWLTRTGRLPEAYVASQGTALHREGRVHVTTAGGELWVGGDCVTCVEGSVLL